MNYEPNPDITRLLLEFAPQLTVAPQQQERVQWQDRAHFLGIAARCMRQALGRLREAQDVFQEGITLSRALGEEGAAEGVADSGTGLWRGLLFLCASPGLVGSCRLKTISVPPTPLAAYPPV